MLSVTLFKAAPHRANAIDKRAIANLRCHKENKPKGRENPSFSLCPTPKATTQEPPCGGVMRFCF